MPSSSEENDEVEVEDVPGPSHRPSSAAKKKKYDLAFKLSVVEYAEANSKRAAEKHFSIAAKRIRDWCQNKERLKAGKFSGKAGAKRLSGGGRKPILEQFDDELADWVKSERTSKRKVTRTRIQAKARELYMLLTANDATEESSGFHASKGFLHSFMNRHSFTLRRTTTQCQKIPEDLAEKVAEFVSFTSQMRCDKEYTLSNVIGCDETAVWLDDPGPTTVDSRGVKEVSVQTTGHDKLRLTLMLTARADGRKLKPFLLIPRKRPLPAIEKEFSGKLNICYAGGNWMTDALTEQFLRITIGAFSVHPRLLVWDAFRCHKSVATKQVLRQLRVDVSMIPGGTTKFLQPADVSWNHPFKLKFRGFYDEWMATGEKSYTPAGNMRAPGYDLVCKWIVDSWKLLDSEMIVKSFKTCGISVALDGSEDDQIHCLKPDGPCPSAMGLLKEKRALALADPHRTLVPVDEVDDVDEGSGGSESDFSVELNG